MGTGNGIYSLGFDYSTVYKKGGGKKKGAENEKKEKKTEETGNATKLSKWKTCNGEPMTHVNGYFGLDNPHDIQEGDKREKGKGNNEKGQRKKKKKKNLMKKSREKKN
jgi:hypothetical protein